MKNSLRFENQLRDLFTAQQLAVLATDGGHGPYTSLVAFAATEDLKSLLFATTRATRKFANITGNPRVSMLIDSRSNRVADFRDAIAVTALGEAGVAEGTERERLLPIYLARHPHLRAFANSPSSALLKVRVERYYMVSRFQNVTELEMTP
ncbi:pyridoxamine 5'-phosphate oxidase family protein [Desulfonema ishimotonii]|uniref:Pyridoxamine 5'-phosphate oxidase family protein n=1 Tax=Desulfonema ishimotonii TaxID=45657 RepID=A0A401G2I2_9BACT|nr:pyridoxamine 5'-phosphate oxidase family protein [Desulfonema ishimotonii]GBC63434.1 pyridoxamine 5'-phosphate oxidase family protein [Desulfonema ishimotonii]